MIVIALGANLPSRAGSPRNTLNAALRELSLRGIRMGEISSYYVTQAWPDPSDPPFANAVARVETELSPRELMRSEEHTSELQSHVHLVWRLPPEKQKSNLRPHGRLQ